jgi:hypothetical protein
MGIQTPKFSLPLRIDENLVFQTNTKVVRKIVKGNICTYVREQQHN